jgi:hypothetical protein
MRRSPQKFASTFFFLISPLFFLSQTFLGHHIRFTPKQRARTGFSDSIYLVRLEERYKELIYEDGGKTVFFEELLAAKKSYLYSNYEYEKFDDLNAYIQRIADSLNKGYHSNINVKICRDPNVNAHAFEDGTIYVNIGLIAVLRTESQLAAVLGHELTHIYRKHSLSSFEAYRAFVKSTLDAAKNDDSPRKRYERDLQIQEEQSDDGAATLMSETNFNIKGMPELFQIFKEMEASQIDFYGKNKNLDYIKSHPPTDDRYDAAIARSAEAHGTNFPIDSAAFFKFKEMAIDESINLLFEQMGFEECLGKAIDQHIKKPKDPFYLFYVTECTRRIASMDTSWANSYFKPLVERQSFFSDTLNTYKKALAHFRSLNEKNNFTFNNFFLNKNTSPGAVQDSTRQSYYESLYSKAAKFLTQEGTEQKIALVLYDLDYLMLEGKATINKPSFLYDIITVNINDRGKGYVEPDGILFNERAQLKSFLNGVYPYMKVAVPNKDKKLIEEEIKMDLMAVMPELPAFLLKYGFTGIVFSDIAATKQRLIYFDNFDDVMEIWTVKNFLFDFRNNLVKYRGDYFNSKLSDKSNIERYFIGINKMNIKKK